MRVVGSINNVLKIKNLTNSSTIFFFFFFMIRPDHAEHYSSQKAPGSLGDRYCSIKGAYARVDVKPIPYVHSAKLHCCLVENVKRNVLPASRNALRKRVCMRKTSMSIGPLSFRVGFTFRSVWS